MSRPARKPGPRRAPASRARRAISWTGAILTQAALWSLVALAFWTDRPRILDIASHALPHAAALLALIVVALAIVGPRRRALAYALPTLALWASVVWSHRDAPSPGAADRGTALRVVVYNGFHAKSYNDADFLRWFVAQDADLFVLVEPLARTPPKWDEALADFPYRVQAYPGHELSFHIYSRRPLEPDPLRIEGDDAVRPHLLTHAVQRASRTTTRDGTEIRITGIHLRSPRTARDFVIARRDAQTVATRVRARYEQDRVPTIVAGDVNSTPMGRIHRTLRRDGALRGWSRLFGSGTWPAELPSVISLPIDRVYTTPDFVCTRIRTGPAFNSDHRPVVFDLVLIPRDAPAP